MDGYLGNWEPQIDRTYCVGTLHRRDEFSSDIRAAISPFRTRPDEYSTRSHTMRATDIVTYAPKDECEPLRSSTRPIKSSLNLVNPSESSFLRMSWLYTDNLQPLPSSVILEKVRLSCATSLTTVRHAALIRRALLVASDIATVCIDNLCRSYIHGKIPGQPQRQPDRSVMIGAYCTISVFLAPERSTLIQGQS
jgi:hypothetical protein